MQPYQREIKRLASLRGVTKLYHFTPAVNAESILTNGLASQQLLQAHGIDFYAPDSYRFDNRLDALSLSVHSINAQMLAKKVKEHGGDWLILEIDASVLWTHDCRFCWTNAASSQIANCRTFLGGPWAFEEMFKDRPVNLADQRSRREVFGRATCQPTDDQAEVQVFDPIDSDLIIDFTVKSDRVKRSLESLMARLDEPRPIVVNQGIYG